MAVWLIRAGKYGEFEQKFLEDGRAYLCWDGFNVDVSSFDSPEVLQQQIQACYPEVKVKTAQNWRSQIWAFGKRIQVGDLVMMPLKSQPAIQIGEVVGGYTFNPEAPDPYFHWREVKWRSEPVPKSNFGQDLLYSLGAFLTVCRIQRNDAEARIDAMRRNDWSPEKLAEAVGTDSQSLDSDSPEVSDLVAASDLEVTALEQIARAIGVRFKGHGLTKLVAAVLRAQGYSTYQSPEGPDGGADILAGAGPLGFGSPKICVEVKSGASPTDRPTVDQLIGAIQKFGADEGLFVSWGGFKSNVERELAPQFFNVRLWSRDTLIEQILEHYNDLEEEVKAELPLKRVWALALSDEE